MALRELGVTTGRVARFLRAVEERLEEGAWFRRIYVVAATVLTWQVTIWAMKFAAESARPGVDVAAIIAAVVSAPSAITGFAFSSYLGSRK